MTLHEALMEQVALLKDHARDLMAQNADLQAQVVYLKHQLTLAQAGQKDGRNA